MRVKGSKSQCHVQWDRLYPAETDWIEKIILKHQGNAKQGYIKDIKVSFDQLQRRLLKRKGSLDFNLWRHNNYKWSVLSFNFLLIWNGKCPPVFSHIYQCISSPQSNVYYSVNKCCFPILLDTPHLPVPFSHPGAFSLRGGCLAGWLQSSRSHGAGVYSFLFPSQPRASEKLRPRLRRLTWLVTVIVV